MGTIFLFIILIVAWVISFVGMVYCLIGAYKSIKGLKRNDEVCLYRTNLLKRCSPNIMLADRLLRKYPYSEMLYSSKPLDDKYWFTPEEIEEINSNSCKTTAEEGK